MKQISFLFILVIFIHCSCQQFKKPSIAKMNQEYSIKKSSDNDSIKSEIPQIIWENKKKKTKDLPPFIYYAPHQDDETIGMGASIAEKVRLGHPVYIVLLTNGANIEILKYLKSLDSNAIMKDVTQARNIEFLAACIELGVSKVFISNNGAGFDETMGKGKIEDKFEETIRFFCDLFPNATHNTVSGNCDSYNNECHKMTTHQAATNALHKLFSRNMVKEINLFRIYIYYNNINSCDRPCSIIKSSKSKDHKVKQKAINQYKLVNHSKKRYGIGYYHSVYALLENAYNSKFEYIDFIENDSMKY
jgi:LmbE family N-acetylglucosaminyl deacetylase